MRVPSASQPSFPRELLFAGAREYGFDLSADSIDRFESYFSLLSEWNTRMNLVSSRELGRFVEYHLLDSLKINSCFPIPTDGTIMDLGSGAGLPGIPLSLVRPGLNCILVESIAKKCLFLSAAVELLDLSHTNVLHTRIEDIDSSLHGSFDCVLTRATVSLHRFLTLSSRFLRPGGSLVSIKGESIEDELFELRKNTSEQLFHIDVLSPKPFSSVRNGTVVVITKY